jgi:hypothetical protein
MQSIQAPHNYQGVPPLVEERLRIELIVSLPSKVAPKIRSIGDRRLPIQASVLIQWSAFT